jgi:hypothetical protein
MNLVQWTRLVEHAREGMSMQTLIKLSVQYFFIKCLCSASLFEGQLC